jgi:hypothetical protein
LELEKLPCSLFLLFWTTGSCEKEELEVCEWNLSSELFTPTDVLIDPNDRIVGNYGGLQLLSRLDKLEAKLLAMHQEKLADSDLSFDIRKATLDDWSGQVEILSLAD